VKKALRALKAEMESPAFAAAFTQPCEWCGMVH